jgi:hypothetical protein
MSTIRKLYRRIMGRYWWLVQFPLLLFVALPGFAQSNDSPPPTTAAPQATVVRARVTQPVDTRDLVPLRGNVHPLARAEYDQGVAPDELPMARMLLVLQRGKD